MCRMGREGVGERKREGMDMVGRERGERNRRDSSYTMLTCFWSLKASILVRSRSGKGVERLCMLWERFSTFSACVRTRGR